MNQTSNKTENTIMKKWSSRVKANTKKIERRQLKIKELNYYLSFLSTPTNDDEINKIKKTIIKIEYEIMGFTELKEIFEERINHENEVRKHKY